MSNIKAAAFLTKLMQENGYRDAKLLPGDRYAVIVTVMFTHSIRTGFVGDRNGVEDQWYYPSYHEAKKALDAWNGIGEPCGWYRHPATGRRVSMEMGEVDGHDRLVSGVGVPYVRR